MSKAILHLESLRKLRARRDPQLGIGSAITQVASRASRAQKKLCELIQLWDDMVPEDLVQHTSLSNLRAGVLYVDVDSSAAAFELDRLLRCGLTDRLRRSFRGTLVRVKTRIGQFESDERGRRR